MMGRKLYHQSVAGISFLTQFSANDLSLDKSGRVLIPSILREYAGFDKNIILVGQGKRFEIWGESQWELGRDSWLAEDFSEEGGVPPELLNLSL